MRKDTSHLRRLDNKDCIRAYGTNFLQYGPKNVLVVSDANVTGPLITTYYHRADYMVVADLDWICRKQLVLEKDKCDTKFMLSHATNWTITDAGISLLKSEDEELGDGSDWYFGSAADEGSWFKALVQYYLAEEVEERCTVQISMPLLCTVLLCNLAKVACLTCALLVRNFHPMATVGNLISSCLKDPDPCTHEQGPISARDMRRDGTCHRKLMCRLHDTFREMRVKHAASFFKHTQSQPWSIEDPSTTHDVVDKSAVTSVVGRRKSS